MTERKISRRSMLGYTAASALAVPAVLATGSLASAKPRMPGAAPSDVPPINVTWSTDFSGGWNGWLDTPWNDQPQGEVQRPTIVDSPAGTGKAGRFHLEGGQQRNESQPEGAQSIGEGQTLIVRFTDFLENGFPVDSDDWQVIMQFKNDGDGSPPCEIKIGHGQYYLDGNSGGWSYDIGPAVTGKPIDIAVRIVFSSDPAKSLMDAWYNGNQSVTGATPKGSGTLYSGVSSYLKTGIYRDPGIGDVGTRYLDSLVIGTPG